MNKFFFSLILLFIFMSSCVYFLLLANELPICLSERRFVPQEEVTQKALEFAYERSVKKKLFEGSFDQFVSSPNVHYLTEKTGFRRYKRHQFPTFYKTIIFVVTQDDTDRPHGRFTIGSDKCARLRINNNPAMVGHLSLERFIRKKTRIERGND